MDPADIAQALRAAMQGEVDFSSRRRAEYSSDASNYRVVPAGGRVPPGHRGHPGRGGGVPAHRDAADHPRGRHLHRGNAVGPGSSWTPPGTWAGSWTSTRRPRTARVEPGVVLASLQAAARPRTGCASAPTRPPSPGPRSAG